MLPRLPTKPEVYPGEDVRPPPETSAASRSMFVKFLQGLVVFVVMFVTLRWIISRGRRGSK